MFTIKRKSTGRRKSIDKSGIRKSKSKHNFNEENTKKEESLSFFGQIRRKIASSLGRNDGASQNEDDLMDYAADLGCFSSSNGKS